MGICSQHLLSPNQLTCSVRFFYQFFLLVLYEVPVPMTGLCHLLSIFLGQTITQTEHHKQKKEMRTTLTVLEPLNFQNKKNNNNKASNKN